MKKTQIIREVIGKAIEPYGFKYLKTEGPERIFERKGTGKVRYYDPDSDIVRQHIIIHEGMHGSWVDFRVWTDTFKPWAVTPNIFPDTHYYEKDNEEDYRKALALVVEDIFSMGFAHLELLSVETPLLVTKAMQEELYANYDALDKKFIEEYNVNPVAETEEDIDEWLRLIDRILIENAQSEYKDVQDLLVKMGAFLGNRTCQLMGQQWGFSEEEMYIYTRTSFADEMYPLNAIFYGWKSYKNKEGEDLCKYTCRYMQKLKDSLKKMKRK